MVYHIYHVSLIFSHSYVILGPISSKSNDPSHSYATLTNRPEWGEIDGKQVQIISEEPYFL